MRIRRFAPLALVLLPLAACGQSGQQATGDPAPVATPVTVPAGVVWKWTGVEGADPVMVPSPARYTLEFLEDGRYSVRADCNSGSGTWSYEGGALQLSAGPMTLAECGPRSLDQRFLQLLESASGFAQEDGRLALNVGTGRTRMRFDAMREISLAGTAWMIRAYNNGRQAVVSVAEDAELHLEFNEDGTITGFAGCNRFNARYTLDAESLRIGTVASTRRMCPPESLMEQEARLFAALQSVAAWENRGGRCQLRTADGALAVDLVAAVTGSVVRSDGPAVPRGAILRIELQDTSRADAIATVVTEQEISLQGQAFPYRFVLDFDPEEIIPSHSYGLRATIWSGEDLLYTTKSAHPVITRDHARFGIELDLEPVGP